MFRKKIADAVERVPTALIIFRPGKDELAAIIIIAIAARDFLQEARVNLDARFELEIAQPDGIPDGESALAFELERQINVRVFAGVYGAASHGVRLCAHSLHIESV